MHLLCAPAQTARTTIVARVVNFVVNMVCVTKEFEVRSDMVCVSRRGWVEKMEVHRGMRGLI